MVGIEYILLIGSALILLSVTIAKLSDNFGVPVLLLFLSVGMLAGSEGPGGIYFDDARLASSVGVIALLFILFGGGLDTNWPRVRPVLGKAASLSTLGVLLTALAIGILVHLALDTSLIAGLLLGAIISSTDAAAVFSVLGSKQVSLRGNLKPLLELESGSNDPMAVFLTIGLIELITIPETTVVRLIALFCLQMGIGALLGLSLGRAMVYLLNKVRFSYEGFYPVFALACVAFIFALTSVLQGSGFLAVYLAGIVVGNSEFVQKKSLFRFVDGLAWLGQICMFLTLGLLVFPSQLVPVIGIGLVVSAFLMFVARPLGVFLALSLTDMTVKEKVFVSWVGLRGAVPIILATFPLTARLPDAGILFNLVFFIVLTSALFQGWSIPLVAKFLGVATPALPKRQFPLEFAAPIDSNTELMDFIVPYHAAVVGKSVVEIGLPPGCLVVLLSRGDEYIVPSGGTTLEESDTLLILVKKAELAAVREIFTKQREHEDVPKESK
ncbi:MAG: potassium/proton antiporter [Ignavibacteriae bacterium]|nr:potassium/proton antiporter [Ignavibacteriota bacterium]